MEDKFTNQEEQLRALTEELSFEIDTAELWGRVEGQLPPAQNERRRPVIWWFAGGALIIAVGILVLNFNSRTEEKMPIAELESKSTIELAKENTNISNKHTDNSSLLLNTSQSNLQLANEKPKQPQNVKSNNVKIPAIHNSNRYDEKSTSGKEDAINQSSTDIISVDALINSSVIKIKEFAEESKNGQRKLIAATLLNTLPLISIENDLEYKFTTKQIEPVIINHWMPYLSITSGINVHRSSIYSNSNEELDLSQFEKESPLIGLSTELRFGYENNKGWRIGLALSHHRLVSRFSQNEDLISSNDVMGTSFSKIDDEGNIINVDGSLLQTTITKYDLNWHRTHDFVGAQLNIGKQIFNQGKFALFTDLSFSKSIWNRRSGYYFTEGNSTINKFSSGEKNPYTNGGYNVGLSFDVEYKINEISICLRPFARIDLNSITQNSNYYQIKNSQYGIQLGIVYRP